MYYDLNVPWNEESQQRIPQLIKLYKKCKKEASFISAAINWLSVLLLF